MFYKITLAIEDNCLGTGYSNKTLTRISLYPCWNKLEAYNKEEWRKSTLYLSFT